MMNGGVISLKLSAVMVTISIKWSSKYQELHIYTFSNVVIIIYKFTIKPDKTIKTSKEIEKEDSKNLIRKNANMLKCYLHFCGQCVGQVRIFEHS